MNTYAPFRVTARTKRRGGKVDTAITSGSEIPVGYRLLTVFVHGYNNSIERADTRWEEDTFPGISALTTHPIFGVVLYRWPGDTHSNRLFSLARYPRSISAAVQAGKELGRYLRQAANKTPGLKVQIVGHSLGCRVVLAAVQELANPPRTVTVDHILLMGAAVPEGECSAPGTWPDKAARRETVLYSPTDKILKRFFPLGERVATPRSPEPLRAVGLTGGPEGRWHGGARRCALNHDEYPQHPDALRYVAELFGPLTERTLTTARTAESHLDTRNLDARPLDAAPSLG